MPDDPAAPPATSAGERVLAGLHKPVHELQRGQAPRLTRLLRRANRRVETLLFDRGVETTEFAAGIEHFHPDRVIYQPSGWRYLRRILPRDEVGPGDVFADLGCGKGRVLMQAARYPFKRVIGVEIDEGLAGVARANLARRSDRARCGAVEVVVADAAEWEIPDDLTVIYLYHPFTGDTFRRFLANVEASLDRSPRRLRVVYALPALEEALLATGRFRLARRTSGRLTQDLRLYDTA